MAETQPSYDTTNPWTRRIAWALLCIAAPLFAAAAFLALQASRGVAYGFSLSLALAAAFGILLPLVVVAAARRAAWQGSAVRLFTLTAGLIGLVLFAFAGVLTWLL